MNVVLSDVTNYDLRFGGFVFSCSTSHVTNHLIKKWLHVIVNCKEYIRNRRVAYDTKY